MSAPMKIHIVKNDQQLGPYDEAQLAQQIEQGAVSYEDLAWVEGMPEWRPLREIASRPAHIPPPLPSSKDNQESAETQYVRAINLIRGWGVPKDEVKGFELLEKAAGQGYATVLSQLYSLRIDTVRVVELLEKAAEQGDIGAQGSLVDIYSSCEDGVPKDRKKAIAWQHKIHEAALQGNAEAQYQCGHMFSGSDRDKAYEWLEKAAGQGYAAAQRYLGNLYKWDDRARGVKWLEKAAMQGDVYAQSALVVIYSKGDDKTPREESKAIAWQHKLTEAALQGNAEAQYSLGILFLNGSGGVEEDEVKGLEWVQKAALQGHLHADSSLMRRGMGRYSPSVSKPRDFR